MKKLYIVSVFLFAALSVNAQFIGNRGKDKKWKAGVTVNTVEPITEGGYDMYFGQARLFNDFSRQKSNASSFGLNVSYMMYENVGVRLSERLSWYKVQDIYNQKDLLSGSDPPTEYIIDTGIVKQSTSVTSLGVFFESKYKRASLYAGFQIVYKNFGPAHERLIYSFFNTKTDTLLNYRYYDIEQEDGFAIGIAPFLGFSVDIYKGLSAGAEFSATYSYYKTGGTLIWTETRIYPTELVQGYRTRSTYEATKFSSLITSFNLSYSF